MRSTKPLLCIRSQHLAMLALVVVSLLAGVMLILVPEKYQIILILVIPAALVAFMILRNPFVGIYLYFLYNFLRPYDFIPALIPLRLTLVIELVTLISWVTRGMITQFRLKWNNFNWLLMGFVGVIAITTVTAMNNRAAYNVFESIAVVFVMYLLATNIVDTNARLRKIIWVLLWVHFYFAMRGVYNYAVLHTIVGGVQTSGQVGSGFLGDENDFALTLNVMIPVAFFMAEYSRTRIKKALCLLFLVSYVFGVVVSFSRGGWVGMVAVLAFCLFNSRRRLVSLCYAAVLGLILLAVSPSSYWQEMGTITDVNEATAVSRLRYWQAAVGMFADHPLVGVGAGNGGYRMPEYIVGLDNPGREWGRTFHGTLPQVLGELGTAGTVLYLMMLFWAGSSLLAVRRSRVDPEGDGFTRLITTSLIGALVGYFACATFLSTLYYPHLWMLYTLVVIARYCAYRKGTSRTELKTGVITGKT
jgi:probable O-glycosylation ligase (exosortase A-associated)